MTESAEKGRERLAEAALDSCSGTGILAYDRNGRVTLWNRALELMTGRSSQEALGHPAAACLGLPEDGEAARALAAAAHGPGDVVMPVLETTVDGEHRILALQASPLVSGEGLLGGLLQVRDVTEERRVASRLRESEGRFRTMADSAPVLLWQADTDARCNFFNESWLRFTGRSLERELGFGWAEGVYAEDFEECIETFMEAFSARRAFRMEYRLRRHDGAYRWVLDSGVPRITSEGHFLGYIGSCIDITQLREAREEIEASLREKEVLLREIHHRVRNNLQVISSLLSLAAERGHGCDIEALFRESRDRVMAMALIHESLYQCGNLEHVEFREYLGRMVENVSASFNGAVGGVELRLDVDDVRLPIDVAIPCGLLINELVTNALKHAFPDGRRGCVSIAMRRAGHGQAELVVADDGVGFAESAGGRGDSDGAGLDLVRTLAHQMRAELQLESAPGRTLVRLRLPLEGGEGA